MPNYPGSDRILSDIRPAFEASGFSGFVASNAADYLAMIQSDADQKLEEVRRELKVAEDRRTAVRAIIKACTGELASGRTTDALLGQLANPDRTGVNTGRKPDDNLACPSKERHLPHTWRFREALTSHRCPGWDVPGRCSLPEITGQCGVPGSHASHDTEGGHCHGRIRGQWEGGTLAARVQPCDQEAEHALHGWTNTDGLMVWCRGRACFPAIADRQCGNQDPHAGHRWTLPSNQTEVCCPGIPA